MTVFNEMKAAPGLCKLKVKLKSYTAIARCFGVSTEAVRLWFLNGVSQDRAEEILTKFPDLCPITDLRPQLKKFLDTYPAKNRR